MIVSIVAIGNSKGVRLPKVVLEQLQIHDQVELKVKNKQIVLEPIRKLPLKGWEEALKKMHTGNEDSILIPDTEESKEFDWEW